MDARRSTNGTARSLTGGLHSPTAIEINPDPHGIIGPFLSGARALQAAKAEEVVLSWLVLLEDGVDPALAATKLLNERESLATDGATRLRVLLKQISEHTAVCRPSARRRRQRADA